MSLSEKIVGSDELMGEKRRDEQQDVAPRSAPAGRAGVLRLLPLALLLATGAVAWFGFDVGQYLSFEALKDHREWLLAQVEQRAALTALAFIAVYALTTAFSIPGGAVLTLLGGFLFGTWIGTLYVSIGATLGAVAVFLAARSALGGLLRARVGGALGRMESGFRENALSYMLVLRLVPIFPFWLVNLVPAFLGVRLSTYVIGTSVGIIPGTLVYASVGNGLGAIFDAGGTPDLGIIFKPEILLPILGLAALSLLPVVYKRWKAGRAAM